MKEGVVSFWVFIDVFFIVVTKGWMAEWSKALVLGTSLRAWVRIPLQSENFFLGPYTKIILIPPSLSICLVTKHHK